MNINTRKLSHTSKPHLTLTSHSSRIIASHSGSCAEATWSLAILIILLTIINKVSGLYLRHSKDDGADNTEMDESAHNY